MRRGLVLLGALALALPSSASADTTLGVTTQPAGSTTADCSTAPGMVVQYTSDPSTPYMVPAADAGDQLAHWSVNTAGDTPGASVTLYVLAPTSSPSTYTFVASDTQQLPNPLPAGGIATFTPHTKILVSAGDTWGLVASGGTVNCLWNGGAVPSGDMLEIYTGVPPTTPGQTVTGTNPSPAGVTLNLGLTIAPAPEDAAVSAAAAPTNATVGNQALLSAQVTNHGDGTAPITFTDSVPSGLKIDATATGDGTCTTVGQLVTCTINNLAAGATVPVEIVVTPAGAGHYANTVAVAVPTGVTDPVAANNTAKATLVVSAPAPPKCVVVALKGAPERIATVVLRALNCKIGKVKKTTSKKVPKGDVISTNPRAGKYAAGRKIAITVSSGKPKKKHKK